jgi:hypothetical protein
MYLKARVAVAVAVFALGFATLSLDARQEVSHPKPTSEAGSVQCRVLETHASATPAALVVIFHQQQKPDQPRLAALIKEHSGSTAEIQIGSAPWTKVTIFRLKTAFGRGMFLLSPSSGKLKDGDTFQIRFANQS